MRSSDRSRSILAVVSLLSLVASVQAEPQHESRRAIPDTIEAVVTLQEYTTIVNSYFIPDGSQLVMGIGQAHDRVWAARQINALTWELIRSVPIFCDAKSPQFPNTCPSELKCSAVQGMVRGFCRPEKLSVSDLAESLTGYKQYVGGMAQATPEQTSAGLSKLTSPGSQDPARHLFALIKIMPPPCREPAVDSATCFDQISIPLSLQSRYLQYWTFEMRQWVEQYRSFWGSIDPSVETRIVTEFKKVDALKSSQKHSEALAALNSLMNAVEDNLRMPCELDEYPCNQSSSIGAGAGPGVRCVPPLAAVHK